MKIPPRHLAIVFVSLALVITTPHIAFAKGSGGGKKPAPSTPVPHHTTIETISATSITVKEPKASKTLAINQYTTITFKGQPVKFDALKPGMRVSVGAASDPNVAERIDAEDPPKDGKK